MGKTKILAISYLFPNVNQPNHGIFVLNRLSAMSKYADITIINPLPDSFLHRRLSKFTHLASVPEQEVQGGMTVYHPRYFSIPGHFKSVEVLSYYQAVLSVLKNLPDKFDLIDLHWTFPDLPTGAFLSKKLSIPFHVTLRGMEAFHLQDSGLRKHIVAHYLKQARHVISLSVEMAETANRLAATGNKTTVIRNGVATDQFYFIDQTECRNKLGLGQDARIIIGVGALIYRKGFDLVIEALKSVISQPELGNTKFYILGAQGAEGDYRKNLYELVERHNLTEHVVFVGAIPNKELITWYNAADVFCLSSRGEGSPNVLSEALACGTPAVAAKVGSVPEIMASEENLGCCIESENIQQLEQGLVQVLTGNYNRVANARNFNKYNWDWCARQVMGVIDSYDFIRNSNHD
jgi:teichuronic acid biosynthesis glycosyltransferase TuaC